MKSALKLSLSILAIAAITFLLNERHRTTSVADFSKPAMVIAGEGGQGGP